MKRVAVVGAARTPIGKFLGSFKSLSAADLGAALLPELFSRSGVTPDQVDEVIFGNGRQAGGGPNVARQISHRAGCPVTTTAFTVNKACASSLKAVSLGAQAIILGEHDIVVAGGTESMTTLPYLLPKMRLGQRLGHDKVVDAMYQDGFLCPLCNELMGATAENLADKYDIPREEQDRYAVESQHRSEKARAEGKFVDEIVPVSIKDRKKGEIVIDTDEHPRDGATMEGIAKLPAVFRENGTVHAGNASGITDGAAAVVLASEDKVNELGLEVLAWVEHWVSAGVEPKHMGLGPVPCVEKLAEKGVTLDDIDLIELNEAFAAQVIACHRELKFDYEKCNVNGGAISLGHPIGATGVRIVVTLLHEMKRQNLKRGLATLCVSGGLGMGITFVRGE
jgi:acetyl-CoA C-acetyltransferase